MKLLRNNGFFRWRRAEEYSEVSKEERPWYIEIPGKNGHVYVHGENTLGAYTDKKGILKKLNELPDVTVQQEGDEFEGTVTFPWTDEHLKAVGKVLKLHKRPKQTKETRKKRSQHMKEYNEQRNSSLSEI